MAAPTVKKPTDADPGDSTKWGAPDAKHAAELLRGEHATEKIQKEAIENTALTLSDAQIVSGEKKYLDTKLAMADSDNSHKYIHKSGNLSADRQIIWPALSADDTPVFENQAQTLANKSINADQNTITNIENADIKAAAGIEYSKLNLATSIVNADIAAAAAIAFSKLASLASGQILVGSAGNVVTAVAMSGDATIVASGAVTLAAAVKVLGLQDTWIPAGAMYPRTSNGCAALAQRETATNKVNNKVLDFDATTQEFAQCTVVFPRNYNNGTIKATPYWTADAGTATEGVVWAVSGGAFSDDDALDTALGTAQTSTDAYIAAGDVHIGPQTAAITIAGTPADKDLVTLQVSRNPGDGGDTKTGDARLLGIVLEYTIDAATAA